MNKLIILGNGFDLAHGLKTSYEDFIRDIIEKSINFNEIVRKELIDVGNLANEYQSYEFISQNFEKLLSFQNKYGKNSF